MLITASNIEKIEELFHKYDNDGSGEISLLEFASFLNDAGIVATNSEIERVAKQLDTNGTGKIDYQEFHRFALRISRHVHQRLREVFNELDKDNSGLMTKDELRQALVQIGEDSSETTVDSMFRLADTSGDGQISYEEFLKLFM
ncbi:hypothetical protein SNEBB_000508 [Seison nebaliae]|nr:hypothetical protein SNEBB_000508 [Seison nebaliae]